MDENYMYEEEIFIKRLPSIKQCLSGELHELTRVSVRLVIEDAHQHFQLR
jgi:hypothetical protein